jgi:hypothetical protein
LAAILVSVIAAGCSGFDFLVANAPVPFVLLRA